MSVTPTFKHPVRRKAPSLFLLLLFLALLTACGSGNPGSDELSGRWEVIGNRDVVVPESFFWFSMDYLEFREGAHILALVNWPPDESREVRLNKQADYALVGDKQIAISGSCRHQDPCVGLYTMRREGDELILTNGNAELVLKYVGPIGQEVPPTIIGPAASPTPNASP